MTEQVSSHFGKLDPVILEGLAATGKVLQSQWVVLAYIREFRKFTSVADFGCGLASWLHAARRMGANEILGLDIPEIPLEKRALRAEEFIEVNLAEPVTLKKKVDLAICVEVAEHVPAAGADTLIASLCAASDWVLFGAAPPFQGGMGHINENWLEYWAQLFANHGYHCYDILRSQFWHDTRIAYYYRQNTCVYVRPGAHYSLKARGYAPTASPQTLIHPELYLKKSKQASPAGVDIPACVRAFYAASKVPAEPAAIGPAAPDGSVAMAGVARSAAPQTDEPGAGKSGVASGATPPAI